MVKVVKDRIFSAAFHPCTSRLLLAAGDKSGHLGLWSPVSFPLHDSLKLCMPSECIDSAMLQLQAGHGRIMVTMWCCMSNALQDCDWGGDGVLLFEPHLHPVSCMAFSASSDLLSLSYDGTLRSTDVEKAVFDDVRGDRAHHCVFF